MVLKGIIKESPWLSKGFFVIILLIQSLVFSFNTFSQTAEAEANFAVCKACHTIGQGKLVGPDLKGVNDRHDEEWMIKFIQNSQALVQAGDPAAVKVWEENNKIPMPPNNLTPDQIRDILLYIKNGGKVAEGEVAVTEEKVSEEVSEQVAFETEKEEFFAEMKRRDSSHMQATFIAMVVLILISLFDLFVSRLVPWHWIHGVIIFISVIIIGEVVFVEAASLGRQKFYQPDQPIWFSHKVHAGQNRIDCKYCHFTADKSMHAGIPPIHVCLNCHNQVKQGKITGTKEIAKIFDAYNNDKPVEWVKVHNLPDHVYFNHAQHVNVGKVECSECHGKVEKMDVVMQVEDLSMGWCIDCHRNKDVQFATNKFYDQFKEMHEKLKNGEKSSVKVLDMGGEECQRCHY